MDNTILSLIIGIASSLVATFIFIGGTSWIKNTFLPWYEDKIYSGIRIDGEWTSKEINVNNNVVNLEGNPFILNLEQKGSKIHGVYKHNYQNIKEEYILEGKIKDMYFLATAVPKSKRATDGMVMLLHVSNEKAELIMKGSVLAQGEFGTVESFEKLKFVWKSS